MINFFLITGEPGVGKTTLIKKLNSILLDKGVLTFGFYTEEVRRNKIREGFDVVTLQGERGRLARDSVLLNSPVKHCVGKYGVLIEEFENIAIPSLCIQQPKNISLLIIDEIGKMESFSSLFNNKIKEIFGEDSKKIVLATIPSRKSNNLIESIRNNSKAKIWQVTRENRNVIHENIVNEIMRTFNPK